MRWALVILVLSGCPKRFVRHVYVPKSSAPCWRECKAQSIECLKGGFADVLRPRSGRAKFCEEERLDCLLTCDGAYETAPIPED